METVELSQQQSARMAELPEDYRVVGAEHRTPLVRKPTGQIIRIQQNGRVTAATIAARRAAVSSRPSAADQLGRRCLMARTIVMPDATHLRFGVKGTVLYAEQVGPEHLDHLRSFEQILERLERAVREEGTAV
jgi:hypothetical protein